MQVTRKTTLGEFQDLLQRNQVRLYCNTLARASLATPERYHVRLVVRNGRPIPGEGETLIDAIAAALDRAGGIL